MWAAVAAWLDAWNNFDTGAALGAALAITTVSSLARTPKLRENDGAPDLPDTLDKFSQHLGWPVAVFWTVVFLAKGNRFDFAAVSALGALVVLAPFLLIYFVTSGELIGRRGVP